MAWLAEHWIWIVGGAAFVVSAVFNIGRGRNSGEVGGSGISDWFDGDGDGGGD